MAPRFIASQLAHPAGLGGRVIRFLMNRHNARLNRFALDQLDVQPGDRVLEIGFGGGLALPALLSSARFVCGVDRSEDAIASATKRFGVAVKDGSADFRPGSVENLPVPSRTFQKALTVNTVYFWSSLEGGMHEIHRVLTPGGRVVIGFLPKVRMDRMNMPPDIFTARSPDEISCALRGAGFREVEIRAPWGSDRPMVATAIANSAMA